MNSHAGETCVEHVYALLDLRNGSCAKGWQVVAASELGINRDARWFRLRSGTSGAILLLGNKLSDARQIDANLSWKGFKVGYNRRYKVAIWATSEDALR